MLIKRGFFADAPNEHFSGYASERVLAALQAAQDKLEAQRTVFFWTWFFGLCAAGGAIWRLSTANSPSPWEFVWLVVGAFALPVGMILHVLSRRWAKLIDEAETAIYREQEAIRLRDEARVRRTVLDM